MYNLAQIRAMNDEATKEAQIEGLEPYIAKVDGDEGVRACKRLGKYIPKGWKQVNVYFVDSSGLGSLDEPALTLEQLLAKVKQGYGYAIGEVGQFQCYIHEYKRI